MDGPSRSSTAARRSRSSTPDRGSPASFPMRRRHLVVPGLLLVLLAAEPKKPDPKDLPRITVSLPLGVAPGQKTKLTLRGLKLDAAAEVRCHAPMATVRLLKKGKAAVPNQQEPARVGDTQAEVELS